MMIQRLLWYFDHCTSGLLVLLHCTLSFAAQCIVIGPVCMFSTGGRAACVCVCVCGSVTTTTRNCVHRSSPKTGFIGKGSDHIQLIIFWPSCAPGKGVCGGTKFLPLPYYSQHGLFASKGVLQRGEIFGSALL